MENKLITNIGLDNVYKLKLPKNVLDDIVNSVKEHIGFIYNPGVDNIDNHLFDDIKKIDEEIIALINDLITDPQYKYDEVFITNLVKTIQLIYADSIHIANIISKKTQPVVVDNRIVEKLQSDHKIVTSAFEQQIATLQGLVSSYQSEIQRLKNEIKQLESKCKKTEMKLNDEIRDLNTKVVKLTLLLSSLPRDNGLKKQVSDLLAEIVALKNQIQQEQLKNRQDQLLLQQDNSNLTDQLKKVIDDMKLLQVKYNDCNNDTQSLIAIKQENKVLNDRLLQLELQIKQNNCDSQIAHLQSNLQTLAKQAQDCEKKQQFVNAEKLKLQQQVDMLTAEVEKHKLQLHNCSNLQTGIDDCKSKLLSQQQVLDAKQKELVSLKTKYDAEIALIKQELAKKEKDMIACSDKLQALTDKNKDLNSQLASNKKKCDADTSDLTKRMEQTSKKYELQVSDLNKQISDLQSDNDTLQENKQLADSNTAKLQKKIDVLTVANTALREENEQLKSIDNSEELARLTRDNAYLHSENERLKGAHKQDMKVMADLQHDIDNANSTIQRLNATLSQYESYNQRCDEIKKQYEKTMIALSENPICSKIIKDHLGLED